jgi:xanthine dehydrogenase accessory factor
MVGPVFDALRARLLENEPVTLASVVETGLSQEKVEVDGGGPSTAGLPSSSDAVNLGAAMLVLADGSSIGTLGNPELDRAVERDAIGHLASGVSALRRYGARGEARLEEVAVFIESYITPARMVICGAVDFSRALARVAKVLGYRVTVCDPRAVFATATRFPMADEIVVEWPDRYLDSIGESLGMRDAICVLTHDPKFDVPALAAAVRTTSGYIGAMGSRRTTADRAGRLREEGLDDEHLARIRAPMGLDIDAHTTEETAISICAEIIAARGGVEAVSPLSRLVGPIHRRPQK